MKNLLRSKAALSTVVTTLIILVVSVLLATVVTFYAINVTTTRVQEESIQITKLHTWQDGTAGTINAETAFLLVNTGGRDIVIDKIAVRGIAAGITSMYSGVPTTAVSDLDPISNTTLSDPDTPAQVGSADLVVGTANTNFIVPSGSSLVVYILNPGHVSVSDIGTTIGVTVFTANAQYYKESNVEATTSALA
jgi:hypothetical protein